MIDFSELPFNTDDLEELKELDINFVFQPIFDTRNLEISAVEALMRPKGMTPIELIAEGVETEDGLNYIRENTGIEYVQGYYLARTKL